VAFDADGRPNLPQLLCRHGLTNPWRIRHALQRCPVRYVLFDVPYHAGRCLVRETLARRRKLLAEEPAAWRVGNPTSTVSAELALPMALFLPLAL
jgi:ATP-dependent DNA ligase